VPVLAHRLVLTAEALAARRSPADLIRSVLQRVVIPHGGSGQVSQPVSGPNGRWLGMRQGR
jgi:MoxR-like ATPase